MKKMLLACCLLVAVSAICPPSASASAEIKTPVPSDCVFCPCDIPDPVNKPVAALPAFLSDDDDQTPPLAWFQDADPGNGGEVASAPLAMPAEPSPQWSLTPPFRRVARLNISRIKTPGLAGACRNGACLALSSFG